MKGWLSNEDRQSVRRYVQTAVEDLYALFYADHSTKVREIGWMDSQCPAYPGARLENEFGGYMRG